MWSFIYEHTPTPLLGVIISATIGAVSAAVQGNAHNVVRGPSKLFLMPACVQIQPVNLMTPDSDSNLSTDGVGSLQNANGDSSTLLPQICAGALLSAAISLARNHAQRSKKTGASSRPTLGHNAANHPLQHKCVHKFAYGGSFLHLPKTVSHRSKLVGCKVPGVRRATSACSREAAVSRRAMMFERFTEKTIKAVMMAQAESRRLGHDHVGTEMLVIGIVAEGTDIGSRALAQLGVKLPEARTVLEEIVGLG